MTSMAEVEKFNLECLERVNELRRQFKVPPLKLRLSLIYKPERVDSYYGAQEWADNLADNNTLQSDSDAFKNDIGESICRMFSERFNTFSGGAVINAWFDEAVEYKGTLSADNVCHPLSFMQLIWSNIRYCGFGCSISKPSSTMYTVARFKPLLPTKTEALAMGFNQQVQKFETTSGSMAFKNTIANNLSQDVAYVKRNLCCSMPENLPVRTVPCQSQSGRYSLSHFIRQTRVTNRIGKHRVGLAYITDKLGKSVDMILIMQNDE